MPKRKLVVSAEDDSELSSPPSELERTPPPKLPSRVTPKIRKLKASARVETDTGTGVKPGTQTRPKRRRVEGKQKEQKEQTVEAITPDKQPSGRPQAASEPEGVASGKVNTNEQKVTRRRKTKEEKEVEAMPLAARTIGHRLHIGAHVSASGGVHKAVLNSVHIGANAFALFLKSQRKWANPALSDEVATAFSANCEQHTYDAARHIVPHGSYLVNLAHTDQARTNQAYEGFLDDLQRCEKLGIKLYNFHPGNTVGNDRAAAIKHLASNINRAHRDTKAVVTLLENMAAGGNVLGSTFEDLRDMIALIDDKDRVGVCLDTCHVFAAGYDLRSPEAYGETMMAFDQTVGLKYLRALHLNDSKAPLGAHRDLHANIGTGFLGLRAFHNIVNDPRLIGLPLVLETPISQTNEDGEPINDEKGKQKEDAGSWAREIKLLESLVGMDVDGEEYLTLDAALTRKGRKERARIMEQTERKREKSLKTATKSKRAKQNGIKPNDDGSSLSELDDESSDKEKSQ